MIKIFMLIIIPFVLFGENHIGTLLRVTPDGTVSPTNVTPYFEDIAEVAAAAQANITEAAIILQLANIVSNRANEIEALLAAREGVGYLRGGVESFEPAGIAHNTNIISSIVKFEKEVTTSNVVGSIYTYFTEDPGNYPYSRVTRNVKETNIWDLVENENVELDEVQVGETLYECYRNDFFLPLSYSNAYFRIYADVQGSGTNQTAMQIYGALKMGDQVGVTVTIIDGTNTIKYVGGPRVQ